MASQLTIVPLTLAQANALVAKWHRHHKPVRGHRFSIGVVRGDGELVGAAIVGRPVARGCAPYSTAEVTRLVSNGCDNACSKLYGACARIAFEMGFEIIQTYILETERGTSLKASGWYRHHLQTRGGEWEHTDGKARRKDQPSCSKVRWSKTLHRWPKGAAEAIKDVRQPPNDRGEGR